MRIGPSFLLGPAEPFHDVLIMTTVMTSVEQIQISYCFPSAVFMTLTFGRTRKQPQGYLNAERVNVVHPLCI